MHGPHQVDPAGRPLRQPANVVARGAPRDVAEEP